MLTGVVEVGLFCSMAKAAYFGNAVGEVNFKMDAMTYLPLQDGSVSIRRSDGTEEILNAPPDVHTASFV